MGYWTELRSWVFKDPGKLIRYIVLFVCSIIVIVQLYQCFSKLSTPPISTHSYYNLNESIEMPAVTICRDPPYKEDVLQNITGVYCVHPKYTTCWKNYPFDDVPLVEFFDNSTFSVEETFQQYGLNGFEENVEIISSMQFYMGRCHTIIPKMMLTRATRESGYSMILKHHVNPLDDDGKYYINDPGWHIYVHDSRENFTEINMKGSGRVEYVFAEINEEVEIKLQSQYFSNVETREKACSSEPGYSDLKCGEVCIWQDLAKKATCSGPWMHDVAEGYCADFSSMKNLTTAYNGVYEDDQDFACNCVQPCESRIFSTYIQNRKSFIQPEPRTQVWVYYTTKLVSMIEERPSYDTTQFIADVGGSLGFLLGLSVLGLIGLLEHIALFLFGGIMKRIQQRHEKTKQEEADQQSQKSVETVDVAIVSKEKF